MNPSSEYLVASINASSSWVQQRYSILGEILDNLGSSQPSTNIEFLV